MQTRNFQSLFEPRLRAANQATLLFTIVLIPFVLTACGVTAERNGSSKSGARGSDGLQISTSNLPNGTVGSSYSSQLDASGGTAPYSWSISNNSLPPGLGLNATSGLVSGEPTRAGSYSVSVAVTDSSNPPIAVGATFGMDVNSAGNDNGGNSSAASGVYGPAVNADALNNVTVGPSVVSYRFRSSHTGTVSKVHFYLIVHGPHAGYNSGTGGTLRIQLETDDGSTNHNPSGTALGTYSIPEPNDPFPVISFSSAPTLKAGELYHLVFTNTDPEPKINYVSVDDLYMPHPLSPMQPGFSNENLATLLQNGPNSWGVYDYNTPIYQVQFTDGTAMGQGYMEVWSDSPQPISGSQTVRETFTPSSEQAVSKISIRLVHLSGSRDLTVRLEQGDGNVVEQGTISGNSIPLASIEGGVWATYKFSSLRTLLEGEEYHLVLEAPSGTLYQAFPIRKGSQEGFQSSTFFNDGYAEFKSGPNWVGWTEWGQANRTDGDLQFYFTAVN